MVLELATGGESGRYFGSGTPGNEGEDCDVREGVEDGDDLVGVGVPGEELEEEESLSSFPPLSKDFILAPTTPCVSK